MKYRYTLIYIKILLLFIISIDCLADKINYLDHVYYKKENNTGNILLDEKIINIFKDELKNHNILDQNGFEISEINISPHDISVDENNYELILVDKPLVASNGYATMILNLFEKGNKTKSIKVSGKVRILKEFFCAAFRLSRDQIISENDIIPCLVDVSEIKDSPCDEVSQIIGKEVKFNIPAGNVIRKKALRIPVIIKRGDKITILGKTENLIIKTEGEAMQNGSEGAMIKVKNISTKKDIIGKIIDSNTVQVVF